MTALILDGKKLAEKIQQSIQSEVVDLVKRHKRAPGLGVLLVGKNPASQTYVANKERYAIRCGFKTFDIKIPDNYTQTKLQEVIANWNSLDEIDGILLQLPLPKELDSNDLLNRIVPEKDADGLHPLNQGLMLRGEGVLRSCTPLGCMRLIDLALSGLAPKLENINYTDIPKVDLSGKTAVVLGRSILVGKPMAMMLLERNATVMMAHSKTKNIVEITKQADILVAAIGKARLVSEEWIKPGALVIDVGMNRDDNGKLCGDVDFEAVSKKASFITPVPGGVGPMTISMLIENTLQSYKHKLQG